MLTLTINGQTLPAEEGQTILDVARRSGIEIPTLCFHPVLPPDGSCRLCTVEILAGSRPGLHTACTYPVEEGLVVQTHSPKVNEARKVILELLLSRTPNVPLIQDMARQYGITEPPFPTENPEEKCVLCGRCVRACHEMVKAGAINFANRGLDRRVGPPFMEKTRVCIGCGACTIVCPTGAIEIVLKEAAEYLAKPLGPTAAIYTPLMQAIPRVPVIDTDTCIRFRQRDRLEGEIADACGACAMVCEAGAVNFEQQDEILELEVGSIIVATGFERPNPALLPQYSYGKYPDILDSMEFERLSNAAGPTKGQILTHDGRVPQAIAFIHCVGSRDEHANRYCSRVCCMHAMKQAHVAKERTGADVYELYMDIRAFGKGYEEFYERVQREGIIFIRGRGAEIVQVGGKLVVKAEDTGIGRPLILPVDMVVLCTGMNPPHDADQVARTFGISRSGDGFFMEDHPKLRPFQTATEGVFLAGTCQAPRDVPDTVAHASAAAAEALKLLSRGEVVISPQIAYIPAELCSGCRICNALCPYNAITFDEEREVSQVNSALCKGCGTCVAACPSGIIIGRHFTDDQIMVQIEALLEPAQ